MNPFEWLANLYGIPPGDYERLFALTWFYLAAIALNLSAFILFFVMWHRGHLSRRMSRASFLKSLEFVMVVDRQLYLRHTGFDRLSPTEAVIFWFIVGCFVLYFLYALIVEWVIPFFLIKVFPFIHIHVFRREPDPDPESLI